MGRLNLTVSTLAPTPSVAPPLQAGDPAALAASEGVRRAAFGGLTWVCRRGVERWLAEVPARAWADPAGQGWQRVKHNAHRDVWQATIHDGAYYLKYYYRRSWLDDLRRLFRPPACRSEWDGGLFALRAGIPAVRPVAYTEGLRRGGRRCALLVSEAVAPAQPLSEFWLQVRSDDDPARRRSDQAHLTELLAEMIARAHQAGFEHLDMHAANILVQSVGPRRYRTAFVDLQSARRGVPLSARAVVRNLAQLNQWFRKHSSAGDRLRFLGAYLRWRNEFETTFAHGRPLELTFVQLVAALDAAARRHAGRLGAQRDRRLWRDGRYFSRLRLPGGWQGMAVARCKHPTDESRASQLELDAQWWRGRLGDPLRWFDAAPAETCKDSHSALVRRALLPCDTGPLAVILKRPRARNWRRRLALLFPPSRSVRGWRVGHALLHRDVPTARPLAVLERRLGPLVRDSLLITEAIPGGCDLETFLRREHGKRSPAEWARLKRELAALLVAQLRRTEERGFVHRDCKASNLLVVEHPQPKLLWIDMDGLRCAGPLTRRRTLRALVRLHVSLRDVPGLTLTDRVRFLKGYCARYGVPPDAWRALWPALAAASAEKVRAAEARRRWKLAHYGRE